MKPDDQFYDSDDDGQHEDEGQIQHADWQQYTQQPVQVNIPPSGSSHQPEPESDDHEDYGGLVPRESRKERRRREAAEREAAQRAQADMAASPQNESAEHDPADTGAPAGPKKSPFAFAARLFKRKPKEAGSEELAAQQEAAMSQPATDAASVEITLPVMATIDPAGLAEFGLDPSTLEAMGLDPATLPQFDPEFLTELGINPNIVIELIRRQYYGHLSESQSAAAVGRKIDVKRVAQIAKRWAPAAAAVAGLSATGAIWFMASGTEDPGKVPEISKSELADETPKADDGTKTALAEPPAATESAPAAAPVPEPANAVAEATPPVAAPVAEEKPAPVPAEEPSKLAASDLPGLPSAPATGESQPPVAAALPGLPAPGEAPPLPPSDVPPLPTGTLPVAEAAPPLPPGDASLPPGPAAVANTDASAKPVEENKETNALPPIAGLAAASAGTGARLATDGLKEAPPLPPDKAADLPGLPMPIAKSEAPPLTGDLARDESIGAAKEAPGLPPLGNVPEPTIKPENDNKGKMAAGLAGLATGLGAGKLADSLKQAGDAAKNVPKPEEPGRVAAASPAEPAALPPVDSPAPRAAEPPASVAANPASGNDLKQPEPKGVPAAGPESPAEKMPAAPVADNIEPPATLKNSDSLADSKTLPGTTRGRAGLPVAQADWPTIPNGKGRVLRSIAAPTRTGANTIAMAGATATGVGLGLAANSTNNRGESGLTGENTQVASVQPISSADIAPIKHVVQSGENFWTISRDYYGSGRYYKALWSANRQQVARIDQLHVGDTIRIPAMESLDKSLIETPNVAGKRQAPTDDQPEAVARSRDNRAVRTGNEIESIPTDAPVAPKRKTMTPQPQNPGEIISEPIGETAARASATGGRRHRVQQGETLRTIARDFLGDARRSSEIITLNSDVLEDSRTPLRPGQVLRMPADSTEQE